MRRHRSLAATASSLSASRRRDDDGATAAMNHSTTSASASQPFRAWRSRSTVCVQVWSSHGSYLPVCDMKVISPRNHRARQAARRACGPAATSAAI